MRSTTHLSSPTVATYFGVYGWLLGLTIGELMIVAAGWPRGAFIIMLIATAMAKAFLICFYFMHLKFDRKVVWLLPAVPVLLGIIFVLALFPDLVFHLTHRMR